LIIQDPFISALLAKHVLFSDLLISISGKETYFHSFIVIIFLLSGLTFSQLTFQCQKAERKADKKDRELLILHSTASISATSLDVNDFLDDVLNELLSYLGANYGFIYLVKPDIGKAILFADAEAPVRLKKALATISLDHPVVVNMMEMNGLPKKIKRLHVLEVESDLFPDMDMDRVIAIPMVARKAVTGFFMFSMKEQLQLSEEDAYVLESVGKLAGITVENIQLLEKTTKAYEELKSLENMKDEFVSNVTHELKTPLISIKGYSEIMYEGMLGDLNEKQKHGMKVIVSNSERLNRLIESLLHMNAFQFKKQHVFSPLSLADVMESAIKSLSSKIEEKGIILTTNYEKSLHFIYGNTELLKQLFLYLLDNAIKFSPYGSRIGIWAYEENGSMHVEVSDNGIGIPENQIPKVFERFYQVDGSMTRNYGGNGLGLYLSKNIVEIHKGDIWLESREGVGTKAHVLLPLYDENGQVVYKSAQAHVDTPISL
jgi:signal transduction histidine kinase